MHTSDTVDLVENEKGGVLCRAVADTSELNLQVTIDGADRTDSFSRIVQEKVVGSGGLSTVRKEVTLEYVTDKPTHTFNAKTMKCSVKTEGYETESTSVLLSVQCKYCIVLYCIVLYCVALRCVALRCVALRCVALRCVALLCVALRCVALRCVAMRCVALRCVALRYVALRCIALHCIVLFCIAGICLG